MSIDILRAQYGETKAKYSSFGAKSETDFYISFGNTPDQFYAISVSRDFPNSGPRIMKMDKAVVLPMVNNWNPNYRLIDLVDHIAAYNQLKLESPITLSPQDVSGFLKLRQLSDIQTNEQRLALIKSMPSIQSYFELENRIKAQTASNREETDLAFSQLISISDQLTSESDQYQELETRLKRAQDELPQIQQASKRNKIQELRNDIQKSVEKIDQLRNDLKSGATQLPKYLTELFQIKEKAIKDKIIADELSKQ